MQTAKIYHNVGEGRFVGTSWNPDTADMKLVHMVAVSGVDSDQAILEDLFRRYNVGDDPEFGTPHPDALHYRAAGLRSLSVGDVIVIDGERAYACAHIGWTPVPEELVK